jgi:hypothetical protein
MTGYEIFDAHLTLIGHAAELVAARGIDAIGIAKMHQAPCLIVRCSDGAALASYGEKPRELLRKWDASMLPGVLRGAA